jgi:hypothetical protein
MSPLHIGGHFDIRDQRYRTELDIGTSDIGLKRAESDIISDIGINFYPISYSRHPEIYNLAQWLRSMALSCETRALGSNSADVLKYFLDIGMDSDVDIRTLPISE